MESLDAGYALLSDVNARNQELQARLRSILPLLWTTNALVMTSAVGPRRRRAADEQSAVGEPDQMLLAVESQSSLQVSRRYKRRVEWEVARRIARVDRELQQYPPAQRSWNQKRREVGPAQSSSYEQRTTALGRTEARGNARARQTVTNGVMVEAIGSQQVRKIWEKPKAATVDDDEVRRVLKHVAAPLRGGAKNVEDKENTNPNLATSAQFEEEFDVNATKEPPVLKNATPTENEASESLDERQVSEGTTEDSKANEPTDAPTTAGDAPPVKAAETKPESLRRLFSDLDTDKDGHVNRIETCMALHRLQISVPTTKIISFFRHIHSSNAKGARSRHTSHLPMKEVINYREFVAFVTAAYDQQQQRKAQRRRIPTWKEQARPLSAPSTSLPIFAHPTNSPKAKRSVRTSTVPGEKELRVYEVNDVGFDQREVALEERVLQEIPDFLVSRILADSSSAASVEVKETAASVVRKSLESLVGKEAVDDKMVNEVTRELIRERLRHITALNNDAEEDVTGLKRAEVYYNEQMIQSNSESGSVAEDSSSEDLIDVLTEEQVSSLVQQIWKDRHSLRLVSLTPVGEVDIEDLPEDPEALTVKLIDEATDTNELSVSASLSDKAVQVFDEDHQQGPPSFFEGVAITTPEESHAVVPELTCLPQTHIGRAILKSLGGSDHDNSHELLRPVASIEILQQLRQQRRMHQAILYNQAPPHTNTIAITNPEPSVSAREQPTGVQISIFSSEEGRESDSESSEEQAQLNNEAERQNLGPSPITEPVPLTHKVLYLDDSMSNGSSFELAKCMSVSSSGFSSSSDSYHAYGISREVDCQLHSKTRSIHRRPYRRRRCLSVSGSSVPDSICSAELSEGEISREDVLDLSDGEIYGESKRNYGRRNNATSNVMKSEEEDNLHSSTEPGELPVLMKAHANFRRQLVAQSTSSSFESGELEDGAIPDK